MRASETGKNGGRGGWIVRNEKEGSDIFHFGANNWYVCGALLHVPHIRLTLWFSCLHAYTECLSLNVSVGSPSCKIGFSTRLLLRSRSSFEGISDPSLGENAELLFSSSLVENGKLHEGVSRYPFKLGHPVYYNSVYNRYCVCKFTCLLSMVVFDRKPPYFYWFPGQNCYQNQLIKVSTPLESAWQTQYRMTHITYYSTFEEMYSCCFAWSYDSVVAHFDIAELIMFVENISSAQISSMEFNY